MTPAAKITKSAEAAAQGIAPDRADFSDVY